MAGNRKYMDAKYERERAEKIREAKAAADTAIDFGGLEKLRGWFR